MNPDPLLAALGGERYGPVWVFPANKQETP